MYKYILFDLDGTITDSSKGITNCVKYALEAARWEIPENDRLLEFIGPPLTEGFMTISKMSEKEAEAATAKFRERYNVTEKESVLMVGDRKHDVVGAHNCGIDVLGVYYGFAKSGELENAVSYTHLTLPTNREV